MFCTVLSSNLVALLALQTTEWITGDKLPYHSSTGLAILPQASERKKKDGRTSPVFFRSSWLKARS
jgi:hypothetical protein